MSTLEIYVVANGELARQALNAVAVLLGSATFKTAIKLSILFGILGTAINYIRGKNLAIFARWFITYFFVAIVMLGPKGNIQIIDSSNPGAVYTVANVPYGLGYPAHLITSAAHGLVTSFEEALHLPDDLTYNKTGMLFGSRVFRLSTEFHIINPVVKAELSEYVKNCVLGDILVNKKYSMAELTESPDLENIITRSSSNIRGIYIGGVFKTCQAAGIDLKQHLRSDIKQNGFKIFGKRIFGRFQPDIAAQKLTNALAETYSFFNYGALANDALQIMTQNVLINGIKDGLLSYTAETGATAALLNLSSTQAMERMRMSLATSRNLATYAIPVMHTVLLLLMMGLFPIMILLSFQPSFTSKVLKNYFYTLIWIESWPLMFACLNMIVTFYSKAEVGVAGLTISNINQLALEHSDVANMAGYMMLSIPFISGGLITGMASAFNHAAGYIGSVMQSSASSAASEIASGNIHLGNSSWANVNANKFDTNTSMMHGMATQQLKTGVIRTKRTDGETTYDGSPAISRLPTSTRISDSLSSSYAKQQEAATAATLNEQKTYEESISKSASDLSSFSESLGKSKSLGENFNSRVGASAAASAARMRSTAENISKREGVDVDSVFRGLTNFSQSGAVKADATFSTREIPIGIAATFKASAGAEAKAGFEHLRTNEAATRQNVGNSFNVTAEEAKRFSQDLHKVEEYSKVNHAETSNSEAASHLFQLSTNLNRAKSASAQYSIHKAESERLSSVASLVQQHSGQIDSDLGQEVANYVVSKAGSAEAESMFAGKDRERLESYVQEYISNTGVEKGIIAKYRQNDFGIDPQRRYQEESAAFTSKKNTVEGAYQDKGQEIGAKIQAKNVGVDDKQYDNIVNRAEGGHTDLIDKMTNKEKSLKGEYSVIKQETAANVAQGKEKTKSRAFNMKDGIKADFAKYESN